MCLLQYELLRLLRGAYASLIFCYATQVALPDVRQYLRMLSTTQKIKLSLRKSGHREHMRVGALHPRLASKRQLLGRQKLLITR